LTPPVKLSIVVAVQHAEGNLPEILRALRPASHAEVEFLFCHTPADPNVPSLLGDKEGDKDNVRVLCSPQGSLIPHLWREGILAAQGDLVATTTAHCIPATDWVETLLGANLKGFAVGGAIENDPEANARSKAIFLLRYAAYAPPQAKREVRELAADNAAYRRVDLLRHKDLLQRGFWEPSFHSWFRAEGIRLELDPRLKVIHRNRYSARQFIAQRLAHGREFGFTRARQRPLLERPLLVLLAPGAFPILLGRILMVARRKPELRNQLATGGFWLAIFTLAWVAGEVSGYCMSLGARQ
jgi:hypothetical protein